MLMGARDTVKAHGLGFGIKVSVSRVSDVERIRMSRFGKISATREPTSYKPQQGSKYFRYLDSGWWCESSGLQGVARGCSKWEQIFKRREDSQISWKRRKCCRLQIGRIEQ